MIIEYDPEVDMVYISKRVDVKPDRWIQVGFTRKEVHDIWCALPNKLPENFYKECEYGKS